MKLVFLIPDFDIVDDFPFSQGTQAWTGGKPDWTKADSKKTFTAQVRSLDIKCADPLTLGSDYTAYAFSAHMDPTTGQPKILGTKKSTIVR